MKISCIYKISSSTFPNRVYIGSTSNYKKRIRQHKCDLTASRHNNSKMQRHFCKYGMCDFNSEIIELVSNDALLTREQFYIDTINPYFNLCKTAGSRLGAKNTNGIKINKYSIDGELICTYNSIKDAREKELIQVRCLTKKNKTIGGYIWVKDGINLPIFSDIKNELDVFKSAKRKKVSQVDKIGNIINVFDGVRVASQKTGIDYRSIAAVAGNSKIRKTAGGFKWVYN